jgi:hypothetical protein
VILYYAMGGGLGHLTRARAFLHTLGIAEPVTLLTASPFAADRRVTGDAAVLTVPLALAADATAYRAWLRATLDRLAPSAIYLDAFPAGITGEWCDLPLPAGTPVYHLARLLRWDEYARQLRGAPPPLALTYLLEPLAAEHERWLWQHSRDLLPLALTDPPAPAGAALARLRERLAAGGRPLWLIVHAGPPGEIVELAAYAGEVRRMEGVAPRLVIVAPGRPVGLPPAVEQVDFYPATLLFPLADRIFTAAGFNAMRQTEVYREKHRFLPFARRFDDQFRRAARRRGETAGGDQPAAR